MTLLRWLLPTSAVSLLTAAFVIAKTARDALYLQDEGLRTVPLAFVLIAVLSIPQARLVLASFSRFGPRRTRVAMQWLAAAGLALYFPFATSGSSSANDAFFIAVPLVFSVLFSATWLLTSELFEGSTPDSMWTAHNRVTVASMLGGMVGAAFAERLGAILGPRNLVLVAALLVVATAIVTAHAHRAFPSAMRVNSSARTQSLGTVGGILRSGYAKLLVTIAAAGAFAGVMIDFQFYADAASSGRGAEASTTYFASVYFLVNAGALLFQVLLGTRLQRFLGLAGALMVLPLALLGGGTALAFGGAYVLSAGLRVTEGGLRSSIHRSSWEQAFVGISAYARPVAKVVIDGLCARLAAGLASLLLYCWLTLVVVEGETAAFDASWIRVSIVVSTLTWLLATISLRRLMRACDAERHPFMPPPLPDSCPTTSTLGRSHAMALESADLAKGPGSLP